MPKLTDSRIMACRANRDHFTDRLDADEPGLSLQLGDPSIWWLEHKGHGGKFMRSQVGTWPDLNVRAATARARMMKRQCCAERELVLQEWVVGDLLEHYRNQKLCKQKQGARIGRDLSARLDALRGRRASDIGPDDIWTLFAGGDEASSSKANRSLAYVRAFFSWAVDQGYLLDNPAWGLDLGYYEAPRERRLSLLEVAEIWLAAGALGYPYAHAFRLLILTGARREQVARLRGAELVEDGGRLVWTPEAAPRVEPSGERLPDFKIPLPRVACDCVATAQSARRSGSDFLLTTNGKAPLGGWTKKKAELDAAIQAGRQLRAATTVSLPVTAWRINDLRNSFVDLVMDHGLDDPMVAEACLGRVTKFTGGISREWFHSEQMLKSRAELLEVWAQTVLGAAARLSGAPAP